MGACAGSTPPAVDPPPGTGAGQQPLPLPLPVQVVTPDESVTHALPLLPEPPLTG
jgi:hypothetical protein